jgi:hypothetical protein
VSRCRIGSTKRGLENPRFSIQPSPFPARINQKRAEDTEIVVYGRAGIGICIPPPVDVSVIARS